MKEIIKSIKGVDYFVREDGKIFSTKNIGRGKYHQEIKQRLTKDGYMAITVGKTGFRKQKKVHRIIAEAFIPNPNHLPEVDHIDDNKLNNNVSNLQWISGFDNKAKIPFERRSACRTGSKNGNAKLSENDVVEIRRLYQKDHYNVSQLSEMFHCGWTTIKHIIDRDTWRNI